MHPSEALSPRDALGARVTAFVLDLAVVLLAAGPLAGAAGWGMAAVVALLYLGLLPGITGYTCGKAFLGAKVVKAGTTEAPGAARGVVRALIGLVELPVFLIAAIVSGSNDRRRRVGDLAAGTEVVGLAVAPSLVVRYAAAYVVLLSLFLGLSTLNTLLIVWAILIPMGIAIAAVVIGARRSALATAWLVAAGFTLVPAAYQSFAGLCAKGEGTCVDVASSRKAIPALIVIALTLAAFFALKGTTARMVLAVGTLVAGGLMVARLFDTDNMNLGAIVLILLLAGAVVNEILGRLAQQRAAAIDAATA